MSAGVRIGCRGSELSTWQARWVAARLEVALPNLAVELVEITTRGDRHHGSFEGLSETGMFTSELEAALDAGRIDVAVHSLKDLPVSDGAGWPVVSIPLRDDPADALVSREGYALAELPAGARVGTASPRRACLIRARRPELEVVPARGNVDTRVRHLEEGRYDALVLAVAGLTRLGLDGKISERLDARTFPPAPGQGALALQARDDDHAVTAAVVGMEDPRARRTTDAERSCLSALGGGCSRPIGAHARIGDGGELTVWACVGSPDGSRILRTETSGQVPEEVGRAAAASLLDQGARGLLS